MQLMSISAEQTMTSREIADLCKKRHDNVMRVCRELKAEGVCPQIEECSVINDLAGGRSFTEFRLNKRDSVVLVARLSPEFTARLVDRWQELEAQVAKPIAALPDFTNPAIAARAWADEVEAKQALQIELAAAAPKIAFAEAVRNMDGLCKLEEIAKTLGWGRNRFIQALKKGDVLQESRLPYQKYLDLGYFEVVETNPYTDSNGVTKPTFGTRVTGKGQVWLAKKFKPQQKQEKA